MSRRLRLFAAAGHSLRSFAAILCALIAAPALATGGDLLVAPTRLVLTSSSGAEVVLSNKGTQVATYRISLVLRHMTAEGKLVPVEAGSAAEQAALAMISYAPRRITLAPGQPQTVRIGAHLPPDLADGEYRTHLLFRAIPDEANGSAPADNGPGVSISITPIYGIAIPIIVRQGMLAAGAEIRDAHLERIDGQVGIALELHRSGARSIYGTLSVSKPGTAQPIAVMRGIAVYPELASRKVFVQIPAGAAASIMGPVVIRFVEDGVASGVTAELRTDLHP